MAALQVVAYAQVLLIGLEHVVDWACREVFLSDALNAPVLRIIMTKTFTETASVKLLAIYDDT